MRFKTLAIAATGFLCLTLSSAVTAADKVELWKGDLPISQPWLRDHLPDDALLYLRIPHMLGLMATPKGNSLDTALRSRANVENILKLKKGLAENVLEYLPMYEDLRVRMFEQHLRSPLEIAAFMAPAPSAVIVMNLDLTSNEQFRELLGVFSMIDPNIGLTEAMTDDGTGQISGTGLPSFFNFNAASGALVLNVGPGVNRDSFLAMLASLNNTNPDHRMRTMEKSIDDSGQGLFFWANVEQALPMVSAFAGAEAMTQIYEAGLDQVKTLSLGWGVANGKGRIALAADVQEGGRRELLPYVQNDLNAQSAGAPDALLILSIPTADEFSRIEALALSGAEPDTHAGWLEGKASFEELTGITPEELLNAIGPEVVFIFDQAGDYAAVRLRNRGLWEQTLQRLAAKTAAPVEERRIAGKTYFHWDLPGDLSLLADDAEADFGEYAELLRRQRDHYYWTIDGDYLYFASVPQILIDRAAMGANTNIGKWLKTTPRIDGREVVLSLVGNTRKLPKRMYAAYIEILQMAGDFALADIDVWSLPTSEQLGLPETGTLGLTIRLGRPTVAFELSMESNPLELLASGGVGGVAVVGVLAAIAIPAYQDYSTRAQVSEGLALAGAAKAEVSVYYQEHQRFPDAEAASEISIYENAGKYTWSIVVEADSGRIVIDYNGDVGPAGGQIFLRPVDSGGGYIDWECGGTFDDQHLPATCRGDYDGA